MIKVAVSITSAASEPRTTATAATYFSRFRDDAAFRAYGTDCRRPRGCWRFYVKTQTRKHENSHCLVCKRINIHGVSLELTFAGLDTLKPHVINFSVAGTSTVLIPSSARSATTGSAGFLERPALRTRHLIAKGDA